MQYRGLNEALRKRKEGPAPGGAQVSDVNPIFDVHKCKINKHGKKLTSLRYRRRRMFQRTL